MGEELRGTGDPPERKRGWVGVGNNTADICLFLPISTLTAGAQQQVGKEVYQVARWERKEFSEAAAPGHGGLPKIFQKSSFL